MTPAALRRGLFLPPFDDLASPRVMADLGQAAEQAGWDGIFVWDHLLYSEPVRAIADPWIVLAAIASRTTRIALGPMVTPLPRRRPAVVARQAVALDELSQGRLILGFGLGDDGGVGELSRFGEQTDAVDRGAALTEGLEVLTGLLSGAPVHHRGEHYVADCLAGALLAVGVHRAGTLIERRRSRRSDRGREGSNQTPDTLSECLQPETMPSSI